MNRQNSHTQHLPGNAPRASRPSHDPKRVPSRAPTPKPQPIHRHRPGTRSRNIHVRVIHSPPSVVTVPTSLYLDEPATPPASLHLTGPNPASELKDPTLAAGV
ncbi:hypothetical protein BJ165DRAFT_1529457 [Panaeolus papilionaceus]|nr:hypothetical protein BJ165DRAFT_1529457 [Panaeolus papilionaceus]